MKRARKLIASLILGAVILVGAAFGFLSLKSKPSLDEISQKIVLVEIDDSTFKALGRWPFERHIHAAVIARLREAGAEVLIYNIMFRPKGVDDETMVQALNKDGPPTLFPRLDKNQEFLIAPKVHYGQAITQSKMPEVFILQDQASGNLHAVAIASCLVRRLDPCKPVESSVKLIPPSRPFARIAFQDLLKPTPVPEVKNRIVIVGGANEGIVPTRLRDGGRVSDAQVLGEAMISVLLNNS